MRDENVIINEWSEIVARSEQDSKNAFKRKVANGEWDERKEIESIPDEVLQFFYKESWKIEKAKMLQECGNSYE